MSVTGGDITEIRCNHPTLGSSVYNPKASEDSTFDPGGYRTDDDLDSITGNGEAIYKVNNKRPFFEVVCAVDMNERNEFQGTLTNLAQSDQEGDWIISHINGTVQGFKGKPVGDLQWNGNASTFTLKISGGNRMRKIA